MGGTQLAIGHATAHTDDLHRHLAVCHIHLYLLEATGHIEASRTEHKHLLARRGETSRYTHRILFGNTYFHKLFGQRLHKVVECGRTRCIRGYDNDIPIF